MLRKKEYLGILKKGLSKIQVVQLFNEKYHPKPAIRIVERNYHAGRYKAELFCDNCGHRFEREYLTGDKPSKEDCCCPECGFGIVYQEQYYRENDCYCLSDINKAYSLVFDGEKVIQPTFVLFERVWYDEKEYHLIRRFHFDLERGQISSVCMYRGMIIPEEAENNFALLYEKDNGGIAVSRAESPYNWFIKYSYDTPSMGNFHRLGQTDAEAADKRPNENLIRSFCTLLNHSMKYYSKESVTIRSTFDQYPVESVPKKLESHKVFAEDHGDYVVMRAFEDNGDTITEQRRWIYSYKNRVNILLRFSGGGWRDYSDNMSYGFYDEEFLAVKPVLEHSIVGKLGVYLYLEKKDDIFHRRTQDAQHYLQGVLKKPVVESLLKVGMEQLIDEVINGELSVQPAAKTLWQKLKLSKANYRFALQEKLNPAEVKKLQKINAIDPAADREAFRKWVERHSTAEPYQFERIHDLTGCHLKEIVDYLESAYFEQGCESAEAVSLWADYLSMYHQYYGRNVKGAEELYPDSLKKAHDVLAMRNGKWLMSYDRVGSSFIITQALFDKTAAIRKSRARTKVKKGEPSPRIFLGNIRCGHCGYAMNFHETKYPYYICHARQADNDLHCQGTRIMESDLAEVVLNALKQFAQVCLDSERRLEKRREVMRSERAQIQEKIKQQEKIAAKLLLEGNDCFEELLEGKIDDQEYTTRMAENNRKVAECQKQVDALNEALQSMPEVPDAMSEKTLIGKILSLERLDRKLADLTVKCIHVFKDGSLQIEWNFSGLFDSMFPQDLLEVLPRTETVMLNRTWIYCCTVDGWDELERMRQELFAYAEGRQWLVVGDSFDNSKPCLEANGFRQMRDAAKQGRVDNVLVYTLDGLSKRSKNYARFQRQIEKRHVLMYDRNGNLLIGA